ncbi:MAG TPA: nitroreductase family protein [Vicinamibacterales bacterium]|nr:nitroreductase family protein [Vicinamibacterales bacterium]
MEFRTLAEQRATVRQFLPDPVDPADVREMVRLAGLAPSPNNSQPWQFIAISRRSTLEQMAAAVRNRLEDLLPRPADEDARRAGRRVERFSTFFAHAPLVIAVALEPYESVIEGALRGSAVTKARVNAMRGYPDIQSVGAAIEHLLLAAEAMGYGGCWLTGPIVARTAIERLLGVKAPARLIALVAIGRPKDEGSRRRDRKRVEEILRFVD